MTSGSSSSSSRLPSAPSNVFVTVGSTRFDELILQILSKEVIDALAKASTSSVLTIQYGKSDLSTILMHEDSVIFQQTNKSEQTSRGGSIGTLDIPFDQAVQALSGRSKSKQSNLLDDEGMAKLFKLNQQSIHDYDSEEESEDREEFKRSANFSFKIDNVEIKLLDFVDNIRPLLEAADVVISHAGSGTILETLRLPNAIRPKLLIVPNETLMDNHQTELALALAKDNYVKTVRVGVSGDIKSSIDNVLLELLENAKAFTPTPFPPFKPERFRRLIDQEMGYEI